jgi:hypothetical protein
LFYEAQFLMVFCIHGANKGVDRDAVGSVA